MVEIAKQCRDCINGGDRFHEPPEVNDGACGMMSTNSESNCNQFTKRQGS